MDTFKDYAYYYNTFYQSKDYRMEGGLYIPVHIITAQQGEKVHKYLVVCRAVHLINHQYKPGANNFHTYCSKH